MVAAYAFQSDRPRFRDYLPNQDVYNILADRNRHRYLWFPRKNFRAFVVLLPLKFYELFMLVDNFQNTKSRQDRNLGKVLWYSIAAFLNCAHE